jgi:gliding motility-associated-like protein
MKKFLIPIHPRKKKAFQSFIASAIALFAFSVSSFGQCCAKLTSTKTCRDKNTGTASAVPCNPGNYTYLWDDPAAQTSAVATGLAAGTYHVLISGPNFTCPAFDVIVGDSSCTPFSVPNVMTPNGDGINDHFLITGLEKGTALTVYNRWGNVVYTSNNYDNDWDAANLTDGVYFYVLNLPTAEFANGKDDPSRGFVQIITGKN